MKMRLSATLQMPHSRRRDTCPASGAAPGRSDAISTAGALGLRHRLRRFAMTGLCHSRMRGLLGHGPLGISLPLLLTLALLWFVVDLSRAQDQAGELLALINNARITQGLHPYVVSAQLAAAAQRHSDDMAATGQISHTGSDGSSSTQRILEAGYGVYEFGPVVSENIYGGMGGANVPFEGWMSQSGARSNLLHEKYREVGIAVTSDAQGRFFWTLDVGAQPNVLPVLINDGAVSVDTLTVTLRLVPENVVPQGQGTAMGQPVAYRASTSPQFLDAEWLPWAESVSFLLDDRPGQQTIHVQLHDAADRTTISQDSITLTGLQVTGTPTTTEEAVAPATATATTSPTINPTGTPSPSSTPTQTSTPTASATVTPVPTSPASATAEPSATPLPVATDTPVLDVTPTSALSATTTMTRPTPLPSSTDVPPVLPTSTQPSAVPEEEDEPQDRSFASRLAPWAVGLQIIALILGVYVALRRPGEDGELRSGVAQDIDESDREL